ncbi:MAG TPA: ATP-binding protein [Pyrinomonadaceae bacterium]|nr:ATP-binding protein [Pyrinomonadaceae bacterium]
MFRSLFLKIFLWFGLAMISMVLATLAVQQFMLREPPRQPQREAADPALVESSRMAVDTYERDGKAALISYMDQMERRAKMRVFLFGSDLTELSGRRTPFGAREIAQRVLKTNSPEFAPTEFSPLVARPVEGANETRYAFVAELPRRHPPPLIHHVMHILGLILIGSAFCYWLARYLTAPVKKLRIATKELAQGNLSARVGRSGGRRDELVSLGSDFDLMAEQIESLVQAQRRLLGDISHELRSPLARLNVALELARQRSGAETASALARIQREAENLNEMIGQLLTLTRLQTGTREIQKSEFDLCRLVREIADDAEFEAQSGNRAVKLESVAACSFFGNEQLLRRAIENVVRNAVHYTPEGTEVEIEVLETSTTADQKALTITVRDHGPGVPAAALEEIFRPFYRVDDARDREAGGVGLGLAIAQRAIQLHGGTVSAANAPGGGLVVTISLGSEISQ